MLSGKNSQDYNSLDYYYSIDQLNKKTKKDSAFKNEMDFLSSWDITRGNGLLVNNFYKNSNNEWSWKQMISAFENNYPSIFLDGEDNNIQKNNIKISQEEWNNILQTFNNTWDNYLKYFTDREKPIDILNNLIGSIKLDELDDKIKSFYIPWWSKVINALNINWLFTKNLLSANANQPLDYYKFKTYEHNIIFQYPIDNITLSKFNRSGYWFYNVNIDKEYSVYGIISIIVFTMSINLILYIKRW